MSNNPDLESQIWRACNIMRTDDGTTGIMEYVEQLSWMMFLKVFDDLELRFEAEKTAEGEKYHRVISEQFKWSTWAEQDWQGDDLIQYVNSQLFPYLRSLSGDRLAQIISTIFSEIQGNRMRSSFNLKEVISIINEIDFNNPDDPHILSRVYEELLLKLGKEGGVAGEFYTPRPIVRLMVNIVNPQIGETVLDPFCGSCGFLVESYKEMTKSKEITVEDYELLQYNTFYGQEKKPLPYLIGIMNCIVHELLTPNIKRINTLSERVRNIQEFDRICTILTNPPFGGNENKQIQENFPIQVQATELLALQYVMKKLKLNGRCGIVVPDGLLSGTGAYIEVKRELIETMNVHTIISLPVGVFANVSPSGQGPKTSLLFFDKNGPSKQIWYYELQLPNGKNYTKVNPVKDSDFQDCLAKWKNREISPNSWIVDVGALSADYDLTGRNANKADKFLDLEVSKIIPSIEQKLSKMQEYLAEMQKVLDIK